MASPLKLYKTESLSSLKSSSELSLRGSEDTDIRGLQRRFLAKCLLCLSKELSLDPSTPHKSLAWWCLPIIPALGRQRRVDPWRFIASQSRYMDEYQAQ